MMKGTEKQVKYANDIKKVLQVAIADMRESLDKDIWKKEETKIKHTGRINDLEASINSIEEASIMIENYKEYLNMNNSQRILELGKSAKITMTLLDEAIQKYIED